MTWIGPSLPVPPSWPRPEGPSPDLRRTDRGIPVSASGRWPDPGPFRPDGPLRPDVTRGLDELLSARHRRGRGTGAPFPVGFGETGPQYAERLREAGYEIHGSRVREIPPNHDGSGGDRTRGRQRRLE